MITVSDKWLDIQQRFLLPETYIEIDCAITEEGAQESATAYGTDEEVFSDVDSVLDDDANVAKYATNELNLWALDGTREILPNNGVDKAGYVSSIESTGSVALVFPEIRTSAVAGVTITWSEKFGEYPTVFTVTAKNGSTVVAETTITNNTALTSIVSLKLENYDSITITVHDWFLPNRRARIEKLAIGHVLTLTKKDILSFSHEQHGDLLSAEIPKYSIEFTMDNTDGRWDPNNPTGMEQYLAERQKLTVRYGLDINGTVEWIKGGTFYLSEWETPANGLEARFIARDGFEFLLSPRYTGGANRGDLAFLIRHVTYNDLPKGTPVIVDTPIEESTIRDSIDGTAAEWVQKCANATCCIIRFDRDGAMYIERFNNTLTDYKIPLSLSYSHPEISLSKPLKEVETNYYYTEVTVTRDEETNEVVSTTRDDKVGTYKLTLGSTGETQTVSNDYIITEEEAKAVAEWVGGILTNRKTISGEFRADPRLELYDVITVESKYGDLTPVVITDIKYTFNGSFRGSYTGKVLEV